MLSRETVAILTSLDLVSESVFFIGLALSAVAFARLLWRLGSRA